MPEIVPISEGQVRRARREPRQPSRSSSPGKHDLFPLPLAPFEAMAQYDNWPGYPMTCGAVFHFQGQIHRSKLETAVRIANQRHPLLEAVLSGKGRKLAWVPGGRPLEPVWLGDAEPDDFNVSRPYDLRKESGARIWVQQRGDRARIFTEFHHATCDGAGGLSYMEDVLSLYSQFVLDGRCDTTQLPPSDPSLLLERGSFELRNRYNPFSFIKASLACSELLVRTPVPLATSQTRLVPTVPTSRFVTRRYQANTLGQLRSRAVASGVSLNEFLLARLMSTISHWNRDQGADDGLMRILVPVNLRNRRDLAMPTANRIGYGFVGRRTDRFRSEHAESEQQTLRIIGEQHSAMLRSQMPTRLLQKFALMQQTGTWPIVFSKNRCLATAVFSNLGDPTRRFRNRFPRCGGLIRIGNLLMTDFEGTTALRPLTRAGLFVSTYGNRMNLSARFDPWNYSAADIHHFLDLFESSFPAVRMARAA